MLGIRTEVEAAASGPAASSPSRKWLAAIQHAPTAKAGLATRPENSLKRLMLEGAGPKGRLTRVVWPVPALACFLSGPLCGVTQPGNVRITSPDSHVQLGNLGFAGQPHHM